MDWRAHIMYYYDIELIVNRFTLTDVDNCHVLILYCDYLMKELMLLKAINVHYWGKHPVW